jgi:hypothetical protein
MLERTRQHLQAHQPCRIIERLSMKSRSDIQLIAKKLLEMQPSPVAHLRLLREVLMLDPNHETIRAASKQLEQSRHVRLLRHEQRQDGGWGAFHSRSTASKQKTPSTEVAVERAICLGLNREHGILIKAKEYILSIMRGEIRFPDYHEKNDRWPTGMRMILASTLSLIDPSHEILDEDRALWREIAIRTFQSGTYSEDEEIHAHKSLTGATVKDSYLVINNRYALNILGSKSNLLPPAVEDALLAWLWHHDQGIGYLGMPLAAEPPLSKPGATDRWFASMELLLRLFPRSVNRIAGWIEWMWKRQADDGLWDFGPRLGASTFLPLADDWRQRKQRRIDWSTRVLLLAASCARAAND